MFCSTIFGIFKTIFQTMFENNVGRKLSRENKELSRETKELSRETMLLSGEILF